MTITVGPDEPRPTHHIKLTDGVSTIGLILSDRQGNANPNAYERLPLPRTGIKMYTGEAQYSDQEMPWSTKQQIDFSGGRGSEDLDEAANQFYDSGFSETHIPGKLTIGGQEVPTTGYCKTVQNWPHALGEDNVIWAWAQLRSTTCYVAMKVIPSATLTSELVQIVLRKRGTPTGSFILTIRSDSSGSPNTVLATYTLAPADHPDYMSVVLKCSIVQALTGSTTYWVVASGPSADTATDCWEVLTSWMSLSSVGKSSSNGTAWSTYANEMIYRITETVADFRPILFIYKSALFCAMSYAHKSGAKLYINGDMGLATGAGSGSNTLADTSKSWTTDEYKGCVCILRWGTGAQAQRNYSRITANTADELTVEDNWDLAPSTDTEYTIVASDKWTEVSGHGINRITDVLVWNNMVYFAQGAGDDIDRLRIYDNAGTWTWSWTAESGKAEYLIGQGAGVDAILWRCERGDSTINYATAVAEGGAALTWSSDMYVGDTSQRVSGLAIYGDNNLVYVGKEGSIYKIDNDGTDYTPIRLNIDEMANVCDDRNCVAMLHHNAYLYFSLHDTLQRYYESSLDDVNPGLKPKIKRGPVVDLAGFPNRLLAAIDNKSDNRGYIMAYTGGGWHSVYDGYNLSRVRGMCLQSIPGENVDRLWFNSGSDLCWIPIAINSAEHHQEHYNFFNYRWESYLETSRIYMHLKAQDKYWHELNIEAEYPNVDTSIEFDYRTEADADDNWHYLGKTTSTTSLLAIPVTTSKYIQLRVRPQTLNNDYTPTLKAIIVEGLVKLKINWQTTLNVRLVDRDQDLNGEPDEATMDAKLTQLETWIGLPGTITMTSVRNRLHSKSVFMDAQSLSPLGMVQDLSTERYLFQLVLYDS